MTMTIQEAETNFYSLFPNTQNRMLKTSVVYDAVDSSGNKVPLEAYTIATTLASAEAMIDLKTDASNNKYYDAYPGELISVVGDTSTNNGVYLVLGTQNMLQNGLTLHRVKYDNEPIYSGGGGSDWIISVKKGDIVDVSSYSISGILNKDYGATALFADTSIISVPDMYDTNVGEYSLMYTFKDTSCLDVSVSIPGVQNVEGSGMYDCFLNSAITSFEMPDLVTVEGYGMYECFKNCSNLVSVSFPELTTTSPSTGNYRQQAFCYAFYQCSNLTTASFPKLESVYDNDMLYAFQLCNSLINLEVHPSAISYSEAGRNMTRYMTNLANLTLTQNVSAGHNVYLGWSSHLTADSVLDVLTHLPTDLLPGQYGTVTFYTSGLTVTDYQDGRIQTAYDAATTAGWTIANLTINQP